MNNLSKAKLILYLAAIFVAGGITGATVAVKATKRLAETPPPGRLDAHYLKERFQSKLKLTSEQSNVVDPILEKMSEELKSVRQDCTKRISGIMKTSYDQIGKQLTPEQRQKLEEMHKDHREDRRDSPHKRFKSSSDSSRKSNSVPQNL